MENTTDTPSSKELRIALNPDLHRRLRIIAAEKDKTMTHIVLGLISSWVEKQEAARG